MIRRLLSLIVIAWALGFVWFASTLPQPLAMTTRTDAIVVPTGGGGRIPRGVELLRANAARSVLVSGVDQNVRPAEFATEFSVPMPAMECCITLGYSALDTRGNARETARWMQERGYTSLRLVTSDWHMRRAALELANQLPDDIAVMRDGVRTEPSLWILFIEYHKLMFAWAIQVV